MTETGERARPPQSDFERLHNLLAERLLDPGREFFIAPLINPNEAEFLVPLSEAGPQLEGEENWTIGVLPYLVTERTITQPDVYDQPRKEWPITVPGVTWFSTAPEVVRPSDFILEGRGYLDTPLRSHQQRFRGGGLSARIWLDNQLTARAANAEEMALVLGHVISEYPDLEQVGRQFHTMGPLQTAVLKSAIFIEADDFHLITDTVRQAIEALPSDLAHLARDRIHRSFGKALIGARLKTRLGQHAYDSMGDRFTEAVKKYDEAGLLKEEFWIHSGLHGAAAVIAPAFAPLLRDKLVGPDGARILAEHVEDSRLVARAYITAVLEAYARDNERHLNNARRVLNETHPKDFKKHGENVDLTALIREANKVAAMYNAGIDKRGGDPAEKFSLLPDEPIYYSDAFLRVLSIMRRPEMRQSVRAEQLEQDMIHGEIVSMVFAATTQPPRLSLADISMRFPHMPLSQRRLVAELVEHGMPWGEAVEAPYDQAR